MPLKLMYITNRTDVACIAQKYGVDRIFVDMEYIGKSVRQGGLDTVQSHHTVEDVKALRKVIDKSELMVRVNPIHSETKEYCSSKEEIEEVIKSGADLVMLPFFKTVKEVETFVELVGGRAKVFPLLETPEAVAVIDDILKIQGIDQIHIGINDLSLGYGKKFMFEMLTDGTVEKLCNKFKDKGIPYGFGGIASLDEGMLPGRKVIQEHYRLGSTCAILSRSFCNADKVCINEVERIFDSGLKKIREFEKEVASGKFDLELNRQEVVRAVDKIVQSIK